MVSEPPRRPVLATCVDECVMCDRLWIRLGWSVGMPQPPGRPRGTHHRCGPPAATRRAAHSPTLIHSGAVRNRGPVFRTVGQPGAGPSAYASHRPGYQTACSRLGSREACRKDTTRARVERGAGAPLQLTCHSDAAWIRLTHTLADFRCVRSFCFGGHGREQGPTIKAAIDRFDIWGAGAAERSIEIRGCVWIEFSASVA